VKTLLLADSSYCIFAGHKFDDPFTHFDTYRAEYAFATCGMVMVEVLRGVANPNAMARWKRGFEGLIYLSTVRSTWDLARQISWRLERAGRRLPTPDIVIAAWAIEAGAVVLTRDKRFAEIPELTVVSSL